MSYKLSVNPSQLEQKGAYLIGLLLLVGALVIGLYTYKDYGIAWDEQVQREMGIVSTNFILNDDQRLTTYLERDHGVGFEVPLIVAERVLGLDDSRDIYLARHLITHIFFAFSCFCGYILIYRLFKNKWLACLGFLMLFMHPRIFAHSFFNTKDIPFLSATLIVLTLMEVAFQKDKVGWYFLLGAACGYTTSIRIMGVLFFIVILFFLVIDLWSSTGIKVKFRKSAMAIATFIVSFLMILYLCYPYLWISPVKNFLEVFNSLSRFRWEGAVLLKGTQFLQDVIPWYYLPLWISVTIPILWLLAGISGIICLIRSFFHSPSLFLSNTRERNFLISLIFCLGPIIAVILFKSVVYDDWRHLYFIYPPFVLLGVYAINKLLENGRCLQVVLLSTVQIGLLAIFMIKDHPHQQVFFNMLVSHDEEYLRKNYDLDYWGVSHKQALEFVLKNDASDTIRVYGRSPVLNNRDILPSSDRQRIIFVDDKSEAKYFITNFRDHPADYYEHSEVFYNVKVLNSSIVRVYKLR